MRYIVNKIFSLEALMRVPFSPPSISEKEITAVSDVLRSGWITTGPKTAEFEQALASYCAVEEVFCLNSATAGLSLVLDWFGVGPGDEVITTPYTFAATANIILHRGATPVFVDIQEEDFNLNPSQVEARITARTKAVIAVDFAGWPCDYKKLKEVIRQKNAVFEAKPGTAQERLGRILLVADAAHSFGSEYHGQKAGNFADFDVFSFHAVKNLTTAEGGAIAFHALGKIKADEIRQYLKLMSLHGQSKSALEKQQLAGWFYEISMAGYKYNLTDMAAAMGLVQLERYEELLERRKAICEYYHGNLNPQFWTLPLMQSPARKTNHHLFPLRLKKPDQRDTFIKGMGEAGIAVNVHFIPLPLHPLYKRLGYTMDDLPVALAMYESEVSLPLFAHMTGEQMAYVVETANELGSKLLR